MILNLLNLNIVYSLRIPFGALRSSLLLCSRLVTFEVLVEGILRPLDAIIPSYLRSFSALVEVIEVTQVHVIKIVKVKAVISLLQGIRRVACEGASSLHRLANLIL